MALVDYIFPRRCVACGRFGQYFCPDCRLSVQPILPSESMCPMCGRPAIAGITHPRCQTRYALDGLTSFFHYDGAIRDSIKALKYRYVRNLAVEFVSLVPREAFLSVPRDASCLVPIALHPSRRRYRGFNQAEILGAVVAGALHIPQAADILRRTRATIPQAEVAHRAARMRNMHGVFLAKRVAQISMNIVLFDDVFTTGATMRAAGMVLKRAGARRVWAVSMAR